MNGDGAGHVASDPQIADLIAATSLLAQTQTMSGGLIDGAPARKAAALAGRLAAQVASRFGADDYGAAILADIDGWLAAGADAKPDFSRSRDALRAPEDGAPFFFFGPLRLANGGRAGWRFETFLALRDEPQDAPYRAMYARYPHPKNICQSSHLLAGTEGLARGNNIVFFPENIAAPDTPSAQAYAVFFFNKFQDIFHGLTIPSWDAVGDPAQLTASRTTDRRRYYEARCVWGYLHDYHHHRGARPFDEHIATKTRWFTGLLEELKVDLASYLNCRAGDVPCADMVAEFIVFDRMFRYPTEADWARNFDAGTGLLLASFLHDRGALRLVGGRLSLDFDALDEAAAEFIRRVETIEALDDDAYIAAAKALVREHLPESTIEGARFDAPAILARSPFAGRIGRAPTIAFRFDGRALGAQAPVPA
ncbi:MAG: DUF6421 family protein [Microvirga sp.]|nr:DUF6421 family protein [Microvirga sp.]